MKPWAFLEKYLKIKDKITHIPATYSPYVANMVCQLIAMTQPFILTVIFASCLIYTFIKI